MAATAGPRAAMGPGASPEPRGDALCEAPEALGDEALGSGPSDAAACDRAMRSMDERAAAEREAAHAAIQSAQRCGDLHAAWRWLGRERDATAMVGAPYPTEAIAALAEERCEMCWCIRAGRFELARWIARQRSAQPDDFPRAIFLAASAGQLDLADELARCVAGAIPDAAAEGAPDPKEPLDSDEAEGVDTPERARAVRAMIARSRRVRSTFSASCDAVARGQWEPALLPFAPRGPLLAAADGFELDDGRWGGDHGGDALGRDALGRDAGDALRPAREGARAAVRFWAIRARAFWRRAEAGDTEGAARLAGRTPTLLRWLDADELAARLRGGAALHRAAQAQDPTARPPRDWTALAHCPNGAALLAAIWPQLPLDGVHDGWLSMLNGRWGGGLPPEPERDPFLRAAIRLALGRDPASRGLFLKAMRYPPLPVDAARAAAIRAFFAAFLDVDADAAGECLRAMSLDERDAARPAVERFELAHILAAPDGAPEAEAAHAGGEGSASSVGPPAGQGDAPRDESDQGARPPARDRRAARL